MPPLPKANEPEAEEPAGDGVGAHNANEGQASELPEFMQRFTRFDWGLWGLFIAAGLYSMILIPFRAMLLVHHAFLYTALTGSGLSVLSLAAHNAHRPAFLGITIFVAALSAVKFLPIYYLIGWRSGPEFIDMLFGGKVPMWYRTLESLVARRLGFCLFLSYLPFSPIPSPVLVAIGGVRRRHPVFVGACVFLFASMLKCFYLYLGLQFGEEARATLDTVNRYLTWVTVALVVYFVVVASRRHKAVNSSIQKAKGGA